MVPTRPALHFAARPPATTPTYRPDVGLLVALLAITGAGETGIHCPPRNPRLHHGRSHSFNPREEALLAPRGPHFSPPGIRPRQKPAPAAPTSSTSSCRRTPDPLGGQCGHKRPGPAVYARTPQIEKCRQGLDGRMEATSPRNSTARRSDHFHGVNPSMKIYPGVDLKSTPG